MNQTTSSINPVATVVEQWNAEEAGVPLSQMTGEQAVAAMLAVAVVPPRAIAPPSGKSPEQLLTEYLTPLVAVSGQEAFRTLVLEKAGALMRLVYPAKPIAVGDVVSALLN